MQQLINDTIESILPLIATAITLGITWLGVTFNAWLSAKIKNEQMVSIVSRLNHIITTVVLELQQTEVEIFKTALGENSPGGRKITKEEGKLLLDTALAKVRSYLGQDGLMLIVQLLGQKETAPIDEFLTSRIEATIHSVKNLTPNVVVMPDSTKGK